MRALFVIALLLLRVVFFIVAVVGAGIFTAVLFWLFAAVLALAGLMQLASASSLAYAFLGGALINGWRWMHSERR